MTNDANNAQATLAAELGQLRKRYLEHLRVELGEIATSAASITVGQIDRQAIEAVRHRLHKLAGSAGTFGLATIGERARMLEEMAGAWLDGPVDGPDRASLSAFIEGVNALAAL